MMPTMVTDRATADTTRLLELKAKIKTRTATVAEWAEWNAGLKGAYNATDLNRIETAVAYLEAQFNDLPGELADYLESLGVASDSIYEVPYTCPIDALTTKTDWVIGDDLRVADMTRYIANINALMEIITLPSETPEPPDSMDDLTVAGANNIELILEAIDAATLALEALKKSYADHAAQSWYYSGETYSGE